ncbi:MAG: Tfp pilus assembly protein FimT/FimU [Gemmatimonadales bacterium]
MSPRPIPGQRGIRSRRGFTMIEMALTFVVIGIMTAMMIPKIGRVMQATRVNRQTAIIAGDLEQAFTLAGRLRKPMRLSCACGLGGSYTVADLNGGTVRLSRTLGQDADLGTVTLAFDNSPVDIYPSGVSTVALTARITSGASTRAVTLSTAGLVRIIP